MDFFKKISIFIIVLSAIGICNAGEGPAKVWHEELRDSSEKQKVLGDKTTLDYEIRAREKKINEEQDPKEKESLIEQNKLDIAKRDYLQNLIDTFNARQVLKKYEDDPLAKQTIADNEKARIKLDATIKEISNSIRERFHPSDGGIKLPSVTDIFNKIKEKLSPIISSIISRTPFGRSGATELNIVSIVDNFAQEPATIIDSEQIRQYKKDAILDKLQQLTFGYEHGNSETKPIIAEEIKTMVKDYTTALANLDIKYTVLYKNDPKKLDEMHNQIVKTLTSLGIDQAQINTLNKFRDNAVAEIEKKFRTKDVFGTLEKFFKNTATDSFRSDNYEKKLQETVAKRFSPEELITFKKNMKELETTLDELDFYAEYALNTLIPKDRSQLLDFLQNQYTKLANLYNASVQNNQSGQLKIAERGELNNKVGDLREKAEQASKRLEENAKQEEKNREKQVKIKELNARYKDVTPFSKEGIRLADTAIPKVIDEFKDLLKRNDPTQIESKFNEITRSLDLFSAELKKKERDPSRTAIDKTQSLMDTIINLQDLIETHARTAGLEESELRKLAQYYFKLDQAYSDLYNLRYNDISDLFRQLDDGTIIFIDRAKRGSGESSIIVARLNKNIGSIDDLIAKFEAQSETYSEDSSDIP